MFVTNEIKSLPDDAFLRLPAVLTYTGLKKTMLYQLVQEGKFPAQEKLSVHASGWRVGEVRQWLADPTGRRASQVV